MDIDKFIQKIKAVLKKKNKLDDLQYHPQDPLRGYTDEENLS